MKMKLEKSKPYNWLPPGHIAQPVDRMLPYYKSSQGGSKYVHIIRSANHHFIDGKRTHTAMEFMCGNSGFADKGQLYASLEDDMIVCRGCVSKILD